MEHECCDTCEHQFSVDPCNQCDFDGEELGSHDEGKNTRVSHWEPDFHSRSLIAFGRRAGIEEALQAYRSHSGQSTDAEVRIFSLLLGGHCGAVESVEPDGSAIVRTGK